MLFTLPKCQHCGKEMTRGKYGEPKKYCSDKCRVGSNRAKRKDGIQDKERLS